MFIERDGIYRFIDTNGIIRIFTTNKNMYIHYIDFMKLYNVEERNYNYVLYHLQDFARSIPEIIFDEKIITGINTVRYDNNPGSVYFSCDVFMYFIQEHTYKFSTRLIRSIYNILSKIENINKHNIVYILSDLNKMYTHSENFFYNNNDRKTKFISCLLKTHLYDLGYKIYRSILYKMKAEVIISNYFHEYEFLKNIYLREIF